MSDLHPKPRRRVRLTVIVEADDWNAASRELERLAFDLTAERRKPGERVNLASGGTAAGSTVIGDDDPEITHDSYFRELRAYLAERGK